MSLPSGYKKLEYIQSSGTQYIDTGFKPNQSTKIELDVLSAEGTSSNIPYIFGTQDSSNNYFVATWVLGYGNGMVTTGINLYDGKFHVVKVENGALYKDGSIIAQRTVSSFSIGVPIFLFAVNSSRQSMGYGACKLRSCKIYNNGMLVRDFIPCKNASGVIGLWDDVNSVFYQNAGSGTFISGPEVKGTNKTLIDETEYDLKKGKCLVGGTAYAVKKGRTLIDGTAYEISFRPDICTLIIKGTAEGSATGAVTPTEHKDEPLRYAYSDGTYQLTPGTSITLYAWNYYACQIYVNDTLVARKNGSGKLMYDMVLMEETTNVVITASEYISTIRVTTQ